MTEELDVRRIVREELRHRDSWTGVVLLAGVWFAFGWILNV